MTNEAFNTAYQSAMQAKTQADKNNWLQIAQDLATTGEEKRLLIEQKNFQYAMPSYNAIYAFCKRWMKPERFADVLVQQMRVSLEFYGDSFISYENSVTGQAIMVDRQLKEGEWDEL